MDVPYGTVLATIAADLCKEVCDISSDKWHHADESDYLKVSEGRDGTYAVRAKCKYCHKEFIATGLTADSLSTAYSDYVNTLPAQGYDSAGTLLWQPNWSDIIFPSTLSSIASMNGSIVTISSSGFNFIDRTYPSSNPTAQCTAGVSGTVIGISYSAIDHFDPDPRIPSNALSVSPFSAKFAVPIAGSYTLVQSPFVTAKYEVGGNSNFYDYISWSWWSRGTSKNCGVGGIVSTEAVAVDVSGSTVYRCDVGGERKHVSIVSPIWRVTPIEASVTNNYYISTRVNNFNGDYYNSVTNNYYNNTTIVNETTNNYYDMTTNNNYTMSNWSYDYVSRTYFITLEDGTTVTVQFGDDCMTITKNDVTNSYQYVIKNNGTPDTPTGCKHDWTETIDTAPTCLEGGHASYTCSLCGETYEQNLAAKGHDWKVKEHVNTVYNADGTVETQGHTLYECSVCGEQWYTDTGAPPPDVSGSSNILAWLQEFKIWLGDKLDNLFSGSGGNTFWTTTKDTVADVLSSLLETLLSFITDILGAILDLVKELLSFFFELISSVVISGISGFFSGLKDSSLFDFVQKDEDGSTVALPDGITTVFAFFSGVLLALPVELHSLLFFGTALVVLIGVINIIRS